jgi:hypothetical protein
MRHDKLNASADSATDHRSMLQCNVLVSALAEAYTSSGAYLSNSNSVLCRQKAVRTHSGVSSSSSMSSSSNTSV